MTPWLHVVGDDVEIDILANPRSAKSKIVGIHEDRLKIQLAAPPVDGAANTALIALLSKSLKVKKSAVSLVSGHSSRRKRVRICGVTAADLSELLPAKQPFR